MNGQKNMKKIVLTGGGTAGHVTPNLALLPALREAGYEIGNVDCILVAQAPKMAPRSLLWEGLLVLLVG